MFDQSFCRDLPNKTSIQNVHVFSYGHEYTQANGKFALSVDGDNQLLISRINEVEMLLNEGKPTIPTNLRLEKQTNPFLRTSSAAIRKRLGLENASEASVFAALRAAKDNF